MVTTKERWFTTAFFINAYCDYCEPIQSGDCGGPDRRGEEGVGNVEDIDKGMKLGCGYPMGPFTLLDFVGLDTTYYIANIMFEEFREKRFAPPPLLKRLVLAGHNGRKSGRGFYDHSDPANPKPLF